MDSMQYVLLLTCRMAGVDTKITQTEALLTKIKTAQKHVDGTRDETKTVVSEHKEKLDAFFILGSLKTKFRYYIKIKQLKGANRMTKIHKIRLLPTEFDERKAKPTVQHRER